MSKPLHITEVVLRDAHQSLLATRMRVEDMLPIASELDDIGYWSLEIWGGATFDACIRYLGEDPWQRLRLLKQAMPKTPMQMLLRGQNLLGYRHYADDVVSKFVERAHQSGMDVFRIFDAMNDIRNFRTAVGTAINVGAHAQGTLSYTTSPVHNQQSWVDLAKQLEDLGCHSLCIKDMSGLLKPYEAESLVSAIKQSCDIPLALHCHATTGLSIATALKAVEAGVDILDTAISSMSCTYGHTPTETVVAMLEDTERDTELKLDRLESVARYFRVVRKKYAQWEGQLKGVDSRILIAQVPGGMLTNMESQLKEQGAQDRLDEVLEEIPKVREDLGFIPLVTPTSQIVGTQAVLNVLAGDRYKTLTKETIGLLKGEYGAAPAPVNSDLQQRVLAGEAAVTCRPADRIPDELAALTSELNQLAEEQNIALADSPVDDVLTYALFPQIGLKFLKNRGDVSAFEPLPEDTNTESTDNAPSHTQHPEHEIESDRMVQRYSVRVDGQLFSVEVGPEGQLSEIKEQPEPTQPMAQKTSTQSLAPQTNSQSESLEVSSQMNSLQEVLAPLAGTIFTIKANEGELVAEGDVLVVLEAMKMETEVRAAHAGVVRQVLIKEGDVVSLGMPLMRIES